MQVTRVAIGDEKLVYVLLADKAVEYKNGRSRIVYIGTTKRGVSRIAQSAAFRADKILGTRGVHSLSVRVVTCRRKQRTKTWVKLERALLLAFRDQYGDVPICNSHGKKIRELDEFKHFSRARADRVIEDLR